MVTGSDRDSKVVDDGAQVVRVHVAEFEADGATAQGHVAGTHHCQIRHLSQAIQRVTRVPELERALAETAEHDAQDDGNTAKGTEADK